MSNGALKIQTRERRRGTKVTRVTAIEKLRRQIKTIGRRTREAKERIRIKIKPRLQTTNTKDHIGLSSKRQKTNGHQTPTISIRLPITKATKRTTARRRNDLSLNKQKKTSNLQPN